MVENWPYEQMGPLDRIRVKMPELSKTQKVIAEYILSSYDKVTFLTSAKLSRECSVSEASIIRFATTLGYTGYTEMQRALQDILKNRISMSKRLDMIISQGSDSDSIMKTVMQKSIEGIQKTAVSLDNEKFQQAVDLLVNAERVFLFGSESSYAATYFFALELQRIRSNVFSLNFMSPEFGALGILQPGDVFLAISMPRYAKATIRAMSLAHQANIPTIGITDCFSSPLIPYTTVPLLMDNEMFSYADNIIPSISVVTALLNAVGVATKPQSNINLSKQEQVWKHFDLHFQ